MSYDSGVIVLVISNRSPDYSLNCTPLSPITITYYCHIYIYIYIYITIISNGNIYIYIYIIYNYITFNNCFIIHSKYFQTVKQRKSDGTREFFEYICPSFFLASA